ncbi:CLUMA_CG015645, isoform A [Clunio marinus]|uniref:CLUMA_CG015645, isoform A n=1 Tax=Clunio marinus TaxID=568069 RepID=A0A1J1IP87_9DIPT|nr:CLUMA_CG015645, isoform A [Clunio marinus]
MQSIFQSLNHFYESTAPGRLGERSQFILPSSFSRGFEFRSLVDVPKGFFWLLTTWNRGRQKQINKLQLCRLGNACIQITKA